ncbi:MAG: prenyltransferase [Halobacteriota archaeon]
MANGEPSGDDGATRAQATEIDGSESESNGRSLIDRGGYLLTLSRPRFWLYLAGPIIVAVAAAADSISALFTPSALVLFGYFLLPANVLLYGVNDVYDADIDAANPKKDGRESRWRGDPIALWAIGASAIVGIGVIAVTPRVAWAYLLGFFALAVAYSVPPVRFKTTPIFDSVSNGLYILPGAAAYAVVSGTHPPTVALGGAWLWTMGMHTFSAIPDIVPDRDAGIETTATWLGERRTYVYVVGCWLAASIGFGLVDSRLGWLLLVYPLFAAGVALTDVSVDRAYWWFPALNTVVGALITIGALWRFVPIWEVVP